MQPNAAEIEAIVRVVLQRLRGAAAPEGSQSSDGAPAAALRASQPPLQAESPRTFTLRKRLVTLEELRGRLEGIDVVEIMPAAIVTPAVRDELRELGIQLVRTEHAVGSASVRTGNAKDSRLLVVAQPAKFSLMSVPAEVTATSTNCNADVCRIAAHLNSGGTAAVWCTATPFAAIRSAATNSNLRAVQLSNGSDLARAMKEADPNVVILDDKSWSASDTCELAGKWLGGLA